MNLDKYQSEQDQEQKKQLLELIEQVKEAGVDIRSIRNNILKDFRLKTEKDTKPFAKIAKKQDLKKRKAFIEKYILPSWITYVEPTNEFAPLMREHLKKDDFIPFLAGIFISIHSLNLEKNIDDFIDGILAAMIQRTSVIMQEKQLLEEKEGTNE